MARQAIVVGLGRFGISLAQELDTLGFDVLALDSSDHVIENLQGQLTYMIKGDSTSEAVLRDLGIANYDLGIVAIGSDILANIMTTILLKTLGVKQVIARSNNTLHTQTLERVGADKVVNPEHDAGVRMAHTLFNPDVQDYLSVASKFGISRVKPPTNVVGKTKTAPTKIYTKTRYDYFLLFFFSLKLVKTISFIPLGGIEIKTLFEELRSFNKPWSY